MTPDMVTRSQRFNGERVQDRKEARYEGKVIPWGITYSTPAGVQVGRVVEIRLYAGVLTN